MTPDIPNQFSIRVAELKDAIRITELSHQLGYPASLDQVRTRLEKIVRDENQVVFVAASIDGGVVGWIQVSLKLLLIVEFQAEVEGLVVDEAYRGKRIGRILMEEAEGWAYQKGCKAVYLRSNVIREDAHNFYQTIGYRFIKTQYAFSKDL